MRDPIVALFLVVLLASSAFAAGRLWERFFYRRGWRFGYRDGFGYGRDVGMRLNRQIRTPVAIDRKPLGVVYVSRSARHGRT